MQATHRWLLLRNSDWLVLCNKTLDRLVAHLHLANHHSMAVRLLGLGDIDKLAHSRA